MPRKRRRYRGPAYGEEAHKTASLTKPWKGRGERKKAMKEFHLAACRKDRDNELRVRLYLARTLTTYRPGMRLPMTSINEICVRLDRERSYVAKLKENSDSNGGEIAA